MKEETRVGLRDSQSRGCYPLAASTILVHENVTVMREAGPNYAWLPLSRWRTFTVFTAPTVSAWEGDAWHSWRCTIWEVKVRLKKLIDVVEETGVDAIVLSAWGCGAFGLGAPAVLGVLQEILETRPVNAALRIFAFTIASQGGRRHCGRFDRSMMGVAANPCVCEMYSMAHGGKPSCWCTSCERWT